MVEGNWLPAILGLPIAIAVATLFLVFPHRIVAWQGKFYRKAYKGVLNRSDKEIDEGLQLPTDRALMGKRSDFIRYAETDPQRYQGLILAYRIIGLLMAGMLTLVLALLTLFFVSGR